MLSLAPCWMCSSSYPAKVIGSCFHRYQEAICFSKQVNTTGYLNSKCTPSRNDIVNNTRRLLQSCLLFGTTLRSINSALILTRFHQANKYTHTSRRAINNDLKCCIVPVQRREVQSPAWTPIPKWTAAAGQDFPVKFSRLHREYKLTCRHALPEKFTAF